MYNSRVLHFLFLFYTVFVHTKTYQSSTKYFIERIFFYSEFVLEEIGGGFKKLNFASFTYVAL